MRICFGEFTLDTERRELRRGAAPVALEPQAFDLLEHLARNCDRVISKEELIASVWGGRTVSDAAIDSGVKAARQAVGDSGAAQSVIRTIPRKGLRFIAAAREEDDAGPARVHAAPAPALPGKPSIAVLPFANMSSDPEQEYFADGIAEDIITALSRYGSLFVIARNSSFVYKGGNVDIKRIGRDLGVRYVLEGSVRKSGARVRVTGQLIEAETGNHLWAERYDREIADIFAVQDEITTAVTVAIIPAVNDAELYRAIRKPPDNLDAWAAYQRGLWHLGKSTLSDIASAGRFFRQAIDLDPNFAGGYRGLAWTQVVDGGQYHLDAMTEMLRSAEGFARRAIALDTTDADAHACLSGILLLGHADYPGALLAAERALLLSPNLASAHGEIGRALIFSERPREGLAAVEMCIRLDPSDPMMADRMNMRTIAHYYCRDYEAAAGSALRTARSFPDYPLVYRWLAAAFGQLGRAAEASAALAKAIAVAPGSFDTFVRRKVLWHRPEDYAHMMEGLHKAGWQG